MHFYLNAVEIYAMKYKNNVLEQSKKWIKDMNYYVARAI